MHSKTKYNFSKIKSFILGFLVYFIAVIVADIYGGSGVTNLYYVAIILLCFRSIPQCIIKYRLPIELILYFFLIIVVEYMNVQKSIYYFEGILQLLSIVLLSFYLKTEQRIKSFSYGLAISIFFCCIYFCLFATNRELNYSDNEMRHSLPFFYISSAGMMTALGFFLGLVNFLEKKRRTWLFLCVICFLTCLYTLSKNALLAMVVITIIYLVVIKIITINARWIITMMLLFLFVYFFGGIFNPVLELYSEAMDTSGNEDIINISGRGGIWLFCIETIPDHPWFGHGYYSASELLMEKINENVSQAHNGMFHALLSTGGIGWLLLTIYIIRICLIFKRNMQIIMGNIYLKWIMCIIMYFMIRSITEASFAQCGSLDVFWFFFLSLIMMKFVEKANFASKEV